MTLPEELVLDLYIQPGAKTTQWAGEHDGTPKIRISAPPVDGAANKALTKFLSKEFKTPKSNIRIVSGQSGRRKRVSIIQPKRNPLA